MSRKAAVATAAASSDDDADDVVDEVDSSDNDEDIVVAKAAPAKKGGSKRADHVHELVGQLQNTYENYTITGSDKNTSKNIALLLMVQCPDAHQTSVCVHNLRVRREGKY